MHESPDDIRAIQELLDRSYARAGAHLRRIDTPAALSATHLPAEELPITVHGRAAPVDVSADKSADLRHALLEVYVSRYGEGWEQFLDSGPVYARIEAERMFTFAMPVP